MALVQDTLPGFTGDVAYGLVAAAGTAPEWVSFWRAAVSGFMERPDTRERMAKLLWTPANGSHAEYRDEIARDRETWGKVIRAANIRAGD